MLAESCVYAYPMEVTNGFWPAWGTSKTKDELLCVCFGMGGGIMFVATFFNSSYIFDGDISCVLSNQHDP